MESVPSSSTQQLQHAPSSRPSSDPFSPTASTGEGVILGDSYDEDASSSKVMAIQIAVYSFFTDNSTKLKWGLVAGFSVLYLAYFIYALYYAWDFMRHNLALIILTVICLALIILVVLYRVFAPRLAPLWRNRRHTSAWRIWNKYGKWVFLGLCGVGVIVFIAVDARKTPMRLVSGLGIFLYVLLAALCSKSPSKIPWGLVGWGVLLQMVFGLLVLRWSPGFSAAQWFSTQITTFLGYTEAGTLFVFGANYAEHEFAFLIMMAIVFFGSVTSLLYYFGILQVMIRWFGGLMELVIGIGPAEAFVAAANVFLGPNNSVLTIKQFLPEMTMSELHNIMTSGFSTVTGSLFGLYLSFNINLTHLITASVMSAPGALAVGKLMYPEIGKSKLKHAERIEFTPAPETTFIEAAVNGAIDGAKIVAHILANLVAFVSLLAFFNATIAWFGDRVGIDDLSFQYICQYVFYPLPLLMGIEPADCMDVARLIGTKLVLTDIIGYAELGKLIDNRASGLFPQISPRSEVIATYALCGFGNFGDVGICLGAIGAIAPSRKSDLCAVAFRAMVAGNIACFITACIAGFLYDMDLAGQPT